MAQSEFNFMDLLEDEAWFEASAQLEEAIDCEVLAGYGWGSHLGAMMANPQGYSHFAQLRSMVLQAWRCLVDEWDLGIGAEAAEAKGQALLMERLSHPEAEVQATLLALLEAKLSHPQGEWQMTEAVHSEIRTIFNKVLTLEDWRTIAATARDRVYVHVLQQKMPAPASTALGE